MGKIQNNQSGFGAVEALLILVVVGILGFTGWYVWHAKQSTDKSANATKSSVAQNAPAWKTYTDTTYHFKISYPSNWSVSTTDDKSGSPFANDAAIAFHTLFLKSTTDTTASNRTQYMLYVSNATADRMIEAAKTNLMSNGAGINLKTSATTINSKKATELVATQNNKTLSTDVYISGGSFVYDFESESPFSDGLVASPIATKMLQSFKITE